MNSINETNYEAFYLDYLEGNLSEDLVAEFLIFLAAHPEFEVEMDEIIPLKSLPNNLDSSFKEGLKIVDFEREPIHLNNCEAFFIAEQEGLLSKEKIAELNAFTHAQPHLQKERALFLASVLEADKSIVYANKASLKQKAPLFYLPQIISVAAVFTGFLFYMNHGTDVQPNKLPTQIGKQEVSNALKDSVKVDDSINLPLQSDVINEQIIFNAKHVYPHQQDNESIEADPSKLAKTIKDSTAVVPALENLNDKKIEPLFLNNQENPAPLMVNNTVLETEEQTYAIVEFNKMKNPYSPITNKIEKLIKTDLDLRVAKPTANKSGGFYFKIGKFEFSRRKY